MSILSHLIEDVVPITPVIFSEGEIFRLDPLVPNSRVVPEFILSKNGYEFTTCSNGEIKKFKQEIEDTVSNVYNNQVEKASSVAGALKKKYNYCKRKAQGLDAEDVVVPECKLNLEEEVEKKLTEFSKRTVVLYRKMMAELSKRGRSKTDFSGPLVEYSSTIFQLTPIGSLRAIFQEELEKKDLTQPGKMLHMNDNLRNKITFYEFYLKSILGWGYPIKIRETPGGAQLYSVVPEHIVEDYKSSGREWYRFPATEVYMNLVLENGKVKAESELSLAPKGYFHLFTNPTDNTVCIADLKNKLEEAQINKDDVRRYVPWMIENSAETLVHGYNPDNKSSPHRRFDSDEYKEAYKKMRVDKSTCTRRPDNV